MIELISGLELKKLYPYRWVKLTNLKEISYGFPFRDGLNTDIHQIDREKLKELVDNDNFLDDEKGPIYVGGLSFCRDVDFPKFVDSHGQTVWIREVLIPEDAEVLIFDQERRLVANKLILKPRQLFLDKIYWTQEANPQDSLKIKYFPRLETFTGQEFNRIRKQIWIKVSNSIELEKGYQYRDGLNQDSIKINVYQFDQPGGLEFYPLADLEAHLYDSGTGLYLREVQIPDQATVVQFGTKFKADQLRMSKRGIWYQKIFAEHLTKFYGLALRKMPSEKQTEDLAIKTVIVNGYDLRHVRVDLRTEKVCLAALENNNWAIQLLKPWELTETIINYARKKNPSVHHLIKEISSQ